MPAAATTSCRAAARATGSTAARASTRRTTARPGPTASVYGVYVDLTNNVAFRGEADGDVFTSIENVTGTQYHDDLYGDAGRQCAARAGRHRPSARLRRQRRARRRRRQRYARRRHRHRHDDGRLWRRRLSMSTAPATWSTKVRDNQATTKSNASTSYALSATAEIEFMFTTDQNSTAAINFTGNDFDQYMRRQRGRQRAERRRRRGPPVRARAATTPCWAAPATTSSSATTAPTP